jgi:hypothetical protein
MKRDRMRLLLTHLRNGRSMPLNMELELQSLFGLHVRMCPPRIWAHIRGQGTIDQPR